MLGTARAGKSIARITALPRAERDRGPGLLGGKIKMADNFDAPLEDEALWSEGALGPT